MRVLGIETSCDDTAAAIYDSDHHRFIQLAASQIELHRPYGGVVPELASRDHASHLLPLIDTLLKKTHHEWALEQDTNIIDAIAYTKGPGLSGALLVGASTARSLAFGWQRPCIGVHHLEGHLLAPMLEAHCPRFPFVALLVSGGHTLLVDVKAQGQYQIIGQSLDDAAGEAFDKTAKLLGLDYPGGPAISKIANNGTDARFYFTRPMLNRPGLDFSFSGLKTQVRTIAQSLSDAPHLLNDRDKADIALAFEQCVVDCLIRKSLRALDATGHKRLVIAGGVAANQHLRQQLTKTAQERHFEVFYPAPELCTDNGAMIAYAGYTRLRQNQQDSGLEFGVKSRWSIDSITYP